MGRGIRWGCCWGRRRRGCRSWCRCGTGGCWCRRSRSTAARRCRWRRTWPRPPPRGCGCSCAGTRTCPISARSPRRSGGWSSTSTTSTRPCPGPFEWDVKRLAASLAVAGPGQRVPRQGPPQDRPGGGRRLPHGDARLRAAAVPGRLVRAPGHRAGARPVPVPGQGEQVQGRREAAGQGAHQRQHAGPGQADHHGRRAAADHQRPAADRPGRGGLRRCAGRRDLPAAPLGAGQVPADPAVRPPPPAGAVHAGAGGPQGRRGRQRRHPRLGPADGRLRRRRAAVPAGQGGPALGPGRATAGAASTTTRASASSPGST